MINFLKENLHEADTWATSDIVVLNLIDDKYVGNASMNVTRIFPFLALVNTDNERSE